MASASAARPALRLARYFGRVLLTEDLQHDQEFGAVRVVNPFALPDRTPEEVLEDSSP